MPLLIHNPHPMGKDTPRLLVLRWNHANSRYPPFEVLSWFARWQPHFRSFPCHYGGRRLFPMSLMLHLITPDLGWVGCTHRKWGGRKFVHEPNSAFANRGRGFEFWAIPRMPWLPALINIPGWVVAMIIQGPTTWLWQLALPAAAG